MRVTRCQGMAIALAVATLAAIVAAVWLNNGPDDATPPNPAETSSESVRVPTSKELAAIGSTLSSHDVPQIRKLFAIPDGVRLDPGFVQAVRTWKSVAVETDSYRPTGSESGDVVAQLRTETTTTRWLLRLDLVDGRWLVAGTQELP